MTTDVFSDVAANGRAFFRDCAAAAAHDLGVFGILRRDGWISTEAAATLLGVRMHRLGPLLGAMAVEGWLLGSRDVERLRWKLVTIPERPTVPAEGLGLIAQVFRENVPLPTGSDGLDAVTQTAGEGGSAYLSYLAEKAVAAGDVLFGLPELEAFATGGHLLDVGGGHGQHSVAWMAKHPENRATLVDRAAHLASAAPLGPRGNTVTGDIESVELPGGYDVALVSNVVHLHSDARAITITEAAASCVRPGGVLIIKEILLDELHAGPAAGAYFSLSLVTYTESGRGYEIGELRRMMEVALGCDPNDVVALREPAGLKDQVVLIGRKPGV